MQSFTAPTTKPDLWDFSPLCWTHPGMSEMWQGVMLRYARWIDRLSHQTSNLSCLHNPLQKVICALLNTGFKGIQVVNCLTNYQTTKVMLTKVFPKSFGACTWINKVHSSSRIYSCSMRGTNIARVEGGAHSVPETQMTALRLEIVFLIYFPPPIASEITVMSFDDIIIICSTFSMEKPLHMCKENVMIHLHICWHHCQNLQLLSLHWNHIVFSLSRISCLWHRIYILSIILYLIKMLYNY